MYARIIVALFKLMGNSEGPAAATPWHALNGYWRPVIGLSGRCLFLPPSLKTMQETEGFRTGWAIVHVHERVRTASELSRRKRRLRCRTLRRFKGALRENWLPLKLMLENKQGALE